MPNRGLPRLSGGILARERAAWARPCKVCGGAPAAGVVDTPGGPEPVCAGCIPGAEARGYRVRTEPLK